MGGQLGTKAAFSEINMTPLIDIVLVVLIIMMVNIPIQIEEMGLKLPSTQVTPPPDQPPSEQLVIAIYKPESAGAEPKIALNRRLMGEQEMLFEITRRLRPMANKNVFIDGDVGVPFGNIVDMVDLARQGGAANVGLAKLKPDGCGYPPKEPCRSPLEPTSVSQGAGMPRGIFIGSPLVVGAITEVQADTAIQPLKGQIQQCYLTRLGVRNDLTGSYSVKVEVGPKGELLSPPEVVDDTVGDEELKTCVNTAMAGIRFQPLKAVGDVTTAGIRYPLLFSPG